jgi:hypothetical protein
MAVENIKILDSDVQKELLNSVFPSGLSQFCGNTIDFDNRATREYLYNAVQERAEEQLGTLQDDNPEVPERPVLTSREFPINQEFIQAVGMLFSVYFNDQGAEQSGLVLETNKKDASSAWVCRNDSRSCREDFLQHGKKCLKISFRYEA